MINSEEIAEILDSIPTAAAIVGDDTSLKWVNEAMMRVFSWIDGNSTTSLSFQSLGFFDPAGKPLPPERRPIERSFLSGFPVTNELVGIGTQGMRTPLWFRITTQLRRPADDVARSLLVTLSDANVEVERYRALRSERDNLHCIVENTPVGICITDHNGIFEFANPAYLSFYGYRLREIIGRHFKLVVPERMRAVLTEAHDRFINGQGEVRGEWIVVDRNGHERAVLADATRIVDEDGNPKKVTFVIDISERKRLELELQDKSELLERLSITDELTGLYNRRHADAALAREILRADRTGQALSIALLDIDHFKKVNDRLGHAAGDEVLVGFAGALAAGLRETDLAARFGGEEFLIILPCTRASDALDPMKRVRQHLAAWSRPPRVEPITFSGGIAQYRPGEKSHELIARADGQLYRAKAEGRDRVLHLPLDDPFADPVPRNAGVPTTPPEIL